MGCITQATLEVSFTTVCEDGKICLDIKVTKAINIDPQIFVHRQTLEFDSAGCPIEEFCAIASASQMTELPVGPPGDPFYRKSSAKPCFSTYKNLLDGKCLIQNQIDSLLKSWNKLLHLDTPEVVQFPRP
jgi:hypothetical protein